MSRPRILLLIPTSTYRAEDFLEAAATLGVDVTVASEEAGSLSHRRTGDLLTLDFSQPEAAAAQVAEFARTYPLRAVVAVDDQTTVTAGAVGEALGLPANSPAALRVTRNKLLFRERLRGSGVPQPRFTALGPDQDPAAVARRLSYPSVLKPVWLSGSRGVIRVDSPAEGVAAWERIQALLRRPELQEDPAGEALILAEEFIPGWEVAVEGIVQEGEVQILAIFDKPDPLDGPYFPETIYVTPSRLDASVVDQITEYVRRTCTALGIRHGPLHAEFRGHDEGVFLIELAARTIGGLCSRVLRFGLGVSLEELVIRQALGEDVKALERESAAAGVLMIPTPKTGTIREIAGLNEAREIPGIDEVQVTVHRGQEVEALPEGALYLGFVFARGNSVTEVETALRRAGNVIRFDIEPD